MADPRALTELRNALESDRRLHVRVWQERQFYEEQAGSVVLAPAGIAALVAFVMGLGAVLAAMNTTYGVVATRAREVGTLRALGFSRSAILTCFVLESVALGVAGGLLPAIRAPRLPITSALREA